MDIHPGGVEVFHVLEHAPPLLAELHDVPDILVRGQDMGISKGLLRHLDGAGIGVVGRVVDILHRPIGQGQTIDDAGGGGD